MELLFMLKVACAMSLHCLKDLWLQAAYLQSPALYCASLVWYLEVFMLKLVFPLLVEKASLLVLYGGFELFWRQGQVSISPFSLVGWSDSGHMLIMHIMAQHRAWVMVIPHSHRGSFNIPAASSSPEQCFVFCRACAYQRESWVKGGVLGLS